MRNGIILRMSNYMFNNGEFAVAIGVDRITSAFIQVYDIRHTPFEEKDQADIVIDNRGVQVRTPVIELAMLCIIMKQQFLRAAANGNTRPNLSTDDMLRITNHLDIKVTYEEVAKILDDPP
jgi:hypothetical protein